MGVGDSFVNHSMVGAAVGVRPYGDIRAKVCRETGIPVSGCSDVSWTCAIDPKSRQSAHLAS